ncbi:MAG TPA: metallophosphoesterase [Candidatus Binatia bacterium]|nr:metallophosphoesterase [Candidatus Binatia bacterium]
MRKISRRKFLGMVAAGASAAVAADAFLIEPNRPKVVRREIALRRWPQRMGGFTVALLSDFHYDPYFSVHPLRAAIGIVNGLHPDLIVLTGDFASVPLIGGNHRAGARHVEPCARLLAQMRAPYGLCAVMGNHDVDTDPSRVTAALRENGIRVLRNQSVPVEKDGSRFWLAGIDDLLGKTADLSATLHGIPSDEATILLAHEPDYADVVAAHPVDLQLSGHSHGGQVRIPLVPPLYLPALGRKYIWGQYQIRELTLYTNPGLGTIAIPVRLNCAPEITLLTLRRA